MLSAPQRQVMLLACLLSTPVLSLATTVDVNGGTIGTGGSSSGVFSFTQDGGLFNIVGDYSASVTGSGPVTAIKVDATVTYEGTTPLASDYSLTINDIQDYTLATLPTVGAYSENAGFGGDLGVGSNELIADLTYGSDSLPTLTFSANGYQSTSGPLSGLSSPLEAQAALTFDFAAGATAGAYITSTPEPGGIIPLAVILVFGLGIPAVRRSHLLAKKSMG
jgi:hypothetical protein